MRILIVGNPEATHVGGHFLAAGRGREEDAVSLLSTDGAFKAPRLIRSLCWRLLGHRPPRLGAFGKRLLRRCEQERPDLVLTTGLAPLSRETLTSLRRMKITLACFLTDDPWNSAHHAPWFLKGLNLYDHLFTPRHANEPELRALAHPAVHYLPFAYAPEIHFPPAAADPPLASAGHQKSVLFVGGADEERIQVMKGLLAGRIPIDLWGGYWDRRPGLQAFAHGHAGPAAFRRLVSSAAVNLCLVRRANRDGHSMRTFELPAIGGCMLVEDTEDHRSLFGPDGECVRYFTTQEQLEQQARSLLASPGERQALAGAVHEKICRRGRHTYADRLQAVVDHCY